MNNIFLTGMGRSGTTLLEKLLSNHSDITMFSQPFPLLFTELKKHFLSSLNMQEYYVLNNGPYDEKYDLQEFIDFLESKLITKSELDNLFNEMKNYSGQMTKSDKFQFADSAFLFKTYQNLLQQMVKKNNVKYLGSKEILCEEYIPYFIQHHQKAIVIIRDPRDVLASANYPKGEKYLGNKKPSLFLLRAWRKSVEFTYYLKDNSNFYFLKYEDLVSKPYKELNKITDFLKIKKYQEGHFDNGIYEQSGKLWFANTSFKNVDSFISKKSVGIYGDILTNDEITYTNVICGHEMKWLNYTSDGHEKEAKIINSFKDFDIEEHAYLPKDFSFSEKNIEIERFEKYKNFYK